MSALFSAVPFGAGALIYRDDEVIGALQPAALAEIAVAALNSSAPSQRSGPAITAAAIGAAVAAETGIDVRQLGDRRDAAATWVREHIICLIRDHLGHSYGRIAMLLRLDYSSVRAADSRGRERLGRNGSFAAAHRAIASRLATGSAAADEGATR